jgi:predicted Ser/Thr protein kinase
MRQCPKCSGLFDDACDECPSDGARLGDTDPLLGTILDGRYRLERFLGSGAMGTVYEATQLELGRRVAIKVLRERLPKPSMLSRFEREALAVARLRHPNIVTVYDFAKPSERGAAYLVMEYLQGESLADALRRRQRYVAEEAVRLVEPVAWALHAAHEAGVLHRDLKPQNLFVEREGGDERLKVLDFGVVKLRGWTGGEETAEGELVGTPLYMAPEQAAGEQVDARADVYALAAVLYEMVTGRPPHVAASIAALITRKLTRRAPAASAVAAGVPPGLDEVLDRALAADRRDRYATARELGAALRTALAPRAESGPLTTPLGALVAPERMTSFVGREDDIDRVKALLESSRLVTVAGPGGIGKTRLALEVAGVLAPRYGEHVRFVGLAGVGDGRLVAASVASALGVRETGSRPAAEAAAEALKARSTLLVLDNCEHVVAAAAELAEFLLRADGDVRFMGT